MEFYLSLYIKFHMFQEVIYIEMNIWIVFYLFFKIISMI